MLGWGIALMIIGGLSFILPMFGRQFALVHLIGLSGMGSAVAGLVLIVIGVVLFNKARAQEKQQQAELFTHVQRQAAERQAETQQELQTRIAGMEAKARSVDLEETLVRIKQHVSSGLQLPEAIRQAIPGIMLVHVAALSSEVNGLKATGVPEEDALRAALKRFLAA